ncbi:MAG: hypothetical protein COU81_01120 [Candidatus Portnoybacteria bacterium CG10_big_fil_rev_8_21_14_0_10_36_7]|uniref:DUF2238 domain-containing protein n=1 Tax=Candidatus Portnoybacteria bacterium CG10_big_fil_rev_8_21_14_0_10_36_7 TaxID=1974812 RepID=A0A2M8KEM2_9BACT|nr:MAG: hypothetical protein COU81_01120 [Candidatus Portnoybacteria bacterium CG10_big_fil_rev_8_21_14_0_10_36_7]
MRLSLKYLYRLLLSGLLIFELLNNFSILHFPLSFTWAGLILTLSVAWLGIEIISFISSKLTTRSLNNSAMIAITISLYFDAIGDINLYYQNIASYDQWAHFIGGAAATMVAYSFIKNLSLSSKISLPKIGIYLFSIFTTTCLGSIYEIEEYLEDYFTGSHRLGDGPDTANDLLLSLTGAVMIMIIAMAYNSFKDKNVHN